jgi:hypothetical protein
MRQFKLLLLSLFLTLLTTTAFAAELGAGKELKADKGPTLEQTAEFIMAKFKEFITDRFKIKNKLGQYTLVIQELDFIKFDGCNVSINKGVYLIEFNLADIIDVKPQLTEKALSSNDSPLFAVVLKENKPNILFTSHDDKYQSKAFGIYTKNKEYATRMANAFERAVQLCGGGKEIGKEELF